MNMRPILPLGGAVLALALAGACAPQMAQTEYSPTEQQWKGFLETNYPEWRAPQTIPPIAGMGMEPAPEAMPELLREIIEVGKAVLTIHRDFGDRTNRKHARLKYVVEERGTAWMAAEVNRRTNEGKALAAAHAAECAAAGLPVCDADEYADVVAIAASVARYEAVPGVTLAQWLPTAERELSIFWTGDDGIDRKARLDAYSGGVAFDLKSSKDASARGFARAVSEYGYHIQAAHYTAACEAAGLNVSGFVFAAVEPNAPHVCAMWRLSPLVMARGASDAAKALATIIEARAGRVSGYTTGIEVLPIPWLED